MLVVEEELTFVLWVGAEREGIWWHKQTPQFAQEDSEHSHCQALVLRVIQEVNRTVKYNSSSSVLTLLKHKHKLIKLCISKI